MRTFLQRAEYPFPAGVPTAPGRVVCVTLEHWTPSEPFWHPESWSVETRYAPRAGERNPRVTRARFKTFDAAALRVVRMVEAHGLQRTELPEWMRYCNEQRRHERAEVAA